VVAGRNQEMEGSINERANRQVKSIGIRQQSQQ
jgi:hypothetical protein